MTQPPQELPQEPPPIPPQAAEEEENEGRSFADVAVVVLILLPGIGLVPAAICMITSAITLWRNPDARRSALAWLTLCLVSVLAQIAGYMLWRNV